MSYLVRAGLLAMLGASLAGACGGSPPSPDVPDNPDSGDQQISGRERIGWTQVASTFGEATSYRYMMYVDGAETWLNLTGCQATGERTFDCSAPLPRLSSGRHVLELTAWRNVWESSKSAPLIVVVTTSSVLADTSEAPAAPFPGGDAASAERSTACRPGGAECFDVETLSRDLPDARALAALPDGRVLVVQGTAQVTAISEQGLAAPVALDAPCRAPRESRLSDLVASRNFAHDRYVYAAWTCETPGLPMQVLLASYREIDSTLGEARVVEAFTVEDASVRLTAGPGGDLYLASRLEPGWMLSRATLSDGLIDPLTAPVMRLPDAAALASSDHTLLVLSGDTMMALSPEVAPRTLRIGVIGTSRPRNRTRPQIAIASGRAGASRGDIVWIARNGALGTLNPAASHPVPLPLDAEVVAMTASGEQLYVLVTPAPGTAERALLRLTAR